MPQDLIDFEHMTTYELVRAYNTINRHLDWGSVETLNPTLHEIREECVRRDAERAALRAENAAFLEFFAGVHRVYDKMPRDWGEGYVALGKLLEGEEARLHRLANPGMRGSV